MFNLIIQRHGLILGIILYVIALAFKVVILAVGFLLILLMLPFTLTYDIMKNLIYMYRRYKFDKMQN